MQVHHFSGQYSLVAPLYGLDAETLRTRDQSQPEPLQRWYALRDVSVAGVVSARSRPDGRTFLKFGIADRAAYEPLVEAVDESLRRPLTTIVDAAATDDVAALEATGFRTEVRGEAFRIPFEDALRLVRRAWLPVGYVVRQVDAVDEQALFRLDNAIRDLVPGTDGWVGDRAAFHAELIAPECDPSAFLVAMERASGELVGLVRIWRNPSGPRLGLIGVLPQHRSRPLAAELRRRALTAASTWGFGHIVSETSPDNARTYPRVQRMGWQPTGSFLQLRRPSRHGHAQVSVNDA